MAKKTKKTKLEDNPFFEVTDTRSATKLKNDAKKLAKKTSEQDKEIAQEEKEMLKKFNLVALNIFESDKETIYETVTKNVNAGKLIFHHYSCGTFFYKKV